MNAKFRRDSSLGQKDNGRKFIVPMPSVELQGATIRVKLASQDASWWILCGGNAREDGDAAVQPECFLCAPDPALTFLEQGANFGLAGLGPIVNGYSVVSTREHIRSAADLPVRNREDFLNFAVNLRARLSRHFGSCLVAEHGRLPVCLRQTGLSEAHCYHAHLLFFPGVPVIDALALPYFEQHEVFSSLEEALASAAVDEREYYLLSSKPELVLLLRQPRNIIRQFSRALVAAAIGKPGLADWQVHPDHEGATKNANSLRRILVSAS